MISLTNINKFFGAKQVLHDITFTINKGEIVGLLGPNGAGKTTTMRIMVGYLKATQGKVIIDGKTPDESRLEILKQIGYLPENNPLYQEMKVNEYLDFICRAKGYRFADIKVIIAQTGIEDVVSQKIEELSRGYKQRVGLAAALIGEPTILILDEPTSGLDPIEQEKIRELIKNLGRKKTIILSTHILSEITEAANRVMIIDQGKIVYDGAAPKKRGQIEKLFKSKVSREARKN